MDIVYKISVLIGFSLFYGKFSSAHMDPLVDHPWRSLWLTFQWWTPIAKKFQGSLLFRADFFKNNRPLRIAWKPFDCKTSFCPNSTFSPWKDLRYYSSIAFSLTIQLPLGLRNWKNNIWNQGLITLFTF